MADEFAVVPYSIGRLSELIADGASVGSGKRNPALAAKSHIAYFRGYFDHLKASTIVVEYRYTDRDYLEDFADYYVRCFDDYSKTCTRLHFFAAPFDEEEFVRVLAGSSNRLEEVRGSYLGFVVIKPLPFTVIGRTCLRTYPPEGRRHYPIARPYSASLFGVDLEVRTLAFQEQDTVVAACATSALWSAFHATGILFQHPIPSPVQITRAASQKEIRQQRTIPNYEGLTGGMMAEAVRHVGLEPYCLNVERDEHHFLLRSAAHAYLSGGIPPLLVVELLIEKKATWFHFGFHAVAITGFSLAGPVIPLGQSQFIATASRIDKLYVHDDQVGPFARMDVDGKVVPVQRSATLATQELTLSTGWLADGVPGIIRARPSFLLIPVYHKIRVTYAEIRDLIVQFDGYVKGLVKASGNELEGPIEWEIRLTTVEALKRDVRQSNDLEQHRRLAVQLQPMPRFIWRALASIEGEPTLDLLFDATDISQGCAAYIVIEHASDLGDLIRASLANPTTKAAIDPSLIWRVLEVFDT